MKAKWKCGTDLLIIIAFLLGSQGYMKIRIKPVLQSSSQVHLFKKTQVAYCSTLCLLIFLCPSHVASQLNFLSSGSLAPFFSSLGASLRVNVCSGICSGEKALSCELWGLSPKASPEHPLSRVCNTVVSPWTSAAENKWIREGWGSGNEDANWATDS